MSFADILPIELTNIIFDYTEGYNIFCKCVCKSWQTILIKVKYDEQLIIACWLEHDDPRLLMRAKSHTVILRSMYNTIHIQTIGSAISRERATVLCKLLTKRRIIMDKCLYASTARRAVMYFANEIASCCYDRTGLTYDRTEILRLAFDVENYEFIKSRIVIRADPVNFVYNEVFTATTNVKSIEWLYSQYSIDISNCWHKLRELMRCYGRYSVLEWMENHTPTVIASIKN